MLVHFYATLRPIVGERQVEHPEGDGGTVIELVRGLVRRWPDLEEHMLTEDGHLSRRVNVFLEGRNVRWLDGEDTVLTADARVDIFPPAAGG